MRYNLARIVRDFLTERSKNQTLIISRAVAENRSKGSVKYYVMWKATIKRKIEE